MPHNPSLKSGVEAGIDQLEADRTVALTVVDPADSGETQAENEAPADDGASSEQEPEAIEPSQSERAGIDGLTPSNGGTESYDASRDPRTGRPPNPLEAQRLAREHEYKRSDSEAEESANAPDLDVPEGSGLTDFTSEDEESEAPTTPELQAPARMTSPSTEPEGKAAIDALVQEGTTREQAEELIRRKNL